MSFHVHNQIVKQTYINILPASPKGSNSLVWHASGITVTLKSNPSKYLTFDKENCK